MFRPLQIAGCTIGLAAFLTGCDNGGGAKPKPPARPNGPVSGASGGDGTSADTATQQGNPDRGSGGSSSATSGTTGPKGAPGTISSSGGAGGAINNSGATATQTGSLQAGGTAGTVVGSVPDPVAGSGKIIGTDVDGEFRGPVELAARIAKSAQAAQCFTAQWLEYATGRGVSHVGLRTTADTATIKSAAATLQSEDSIRAMMVAITQSESFLVRDLKAHALVAAPPVLTPIMAAAPQAVAAPQAAAAPAVASGPAFASVVPVLGQKCVPCHSAFASQSGVDNIKGDLLGRVSNGSMPPAGSVKLTADELEKLKAYLGS